MEQVKTNEGKQDTFLEWLLKYNFSKLLGNSSQTLKRAAHFPNTGNFILIEFVDGKEWRINYNGFQEPLFERKWCGDSIVAAYFDSILSLEVNDTNGRSLNFISIDYFENDPYMKALLSHEQFALVCDGYFLKSRLELITTYKIVEGFLVRDQVVMKNNFEM